MTKKQLKPIADKLFKSILDPVGVPYTLGDAIAEHKLSSEDCVKLLKMYAKVNNLDPCLQ